MHPVQAAGAKPAGSVSVNVAAPKPSSHEHAAACFFEDQGLSGFHGNETNSLKTDDSWAMGCGNCNLGFTLYLWMILDGLSISNPFKTFQDYVAATRNLNILRCPASDLAHAVLCCSFQGIGCRVCHRLYMWLCHRRCFIDLIPQEGCHVFCTSPWGCPSAKAAGSQDLITRYKNGMKQTYWSSLKPVETDSSWLDLSQVEIL